MIINLYSFWNNISKNEISFTQFWVEEPSGSLYKLGRTGLMQDLKSKIGINDFRSRRLCPKTYFESTVDKNLNPTLI